MTREEIGNRVNQLRRVGEITRDEVLLFKKWLDDTNEYPLDDTIALLKRIERDTKAIDQQGRGTWVSPHVDRKE